MVAEAEAAQGQTKINQKVAGSGDSGSRDSGSGNGDGNNGGDNTAPMAAVTTAPIWRQQWQRGQSMWAEVIFHIAYYYLHDSTYMLVTKPRNFRYWYCPLQYRYGLQY
jgi:hypothetical protein